VLEAEDVDAQLVTRVAIEDAVRRVRVVIVPDTCMVAADDEMRAAVLRRTMAWNTASFGPPRIASRRVGRERDALPVGSSH